MRGLINYINIVGDCSPYSASFDRWTVVQPCGSEMNHVVKPWLTTVYGALKTNWDYLYLDIVKDPLELIPCQHIFCSVCIFQWLNTNSICPSGNYIIADDSSGLGHLWKLWQTYQEFQLEFCNRYKFMLWLVRKKKKTVWAKIIELCVGGPSCVGGAWNHLHQYDV